VHADQRVKLTVSNGQIIITPVRDEPLTLEQRLAQFDPARHSGEAMQATQQLGAEKW
jgi:antitoxin MazE